MPRKFEPEMKSHALRMFAEALPDHPSKTEAAKHVGELLGTSPETLRTWACREEIDAGLAPGITSEAELEIRRLKRENAELRTANEILKAASVFFAKEIDRPTTR
jgi:transposase